MYVTRYLFLGTYERLNGHLVLSKQEYLPPLLAIQCSETGELLIHENRESLLISNSIVECLTTLEKMVPDTYEEWAKARGEPVSPPKVDRGLQWP
jgi:hypothetical protein